jgi:rfaE bifunctional protein kinase chain/domain
MSFFEKIIDNQILIIGDVMIDSYINGKVSRISPEAPVPVVEYQSRINRLGGAANVALNIKALGAKPILVSTVGNDENGQLFKQLLATENIDFQSIITLDSRQTTIKTRVMSGNQQLLRIDQEDTHDITADEEKIIFEKINQLIDNQTIKAIIFQDYNKGLLTQNLIQRIIKLAVTKNIPTKMLPFSNLILKKLRKHYK